MLDLVVEAAEEPVGDGATLNGAGGQHLAAQVPRRGPSGPVISLPSRLGEGKAGTEPGEGLGGAAKATSQTWPESPVARRPCRSWCGTLGRSVASSQI
ncbi:hypothetical protein Sdia_41670 [Streptomyces diastaticus subsp. diastaticus]|uniref:Uncharacterized protein n=1 Tax=Streptomyces diastaticus subsp. diastaticus TaxID=68040 RepID=A0ABQ1CT89_STRDI|nr:hypothetical protein Sdia_41670 [Streptomyces diastaticus subsp. diastaticus]GGU09921.1 hypothetical protein GCM10015534_10300 [Streptomyces diastaticus subsp. diastaticus]